MFDGNVCKRSRDVCSRTGSQQSYKRDLDPNVGPEVDTRDAA